MIYLLREVAFLRLTIGVGAEVPLTGGLIHFPSSIVIWFSIWVKIITDVIFMLSSDSSTLGTINSSISESSIIQYPSPLTNHDRVSLSSFPPSLLPSPSNISY